MSDFMKRFTTTAAYIIGHSELVERLNHLPSIALVEIYDWTCDYITRGERVYCMDDLDDLFCGLKISEVLESIDYDQFSTYDDYVQFGPHGLLRSRDATDVTDFFDISDLATDLILSPDTVRLPYSYPEYSWVFDLVEQIDAEAAAELE